MGKLHNVQQYKLYSSSNSLIFFWKSHIPPNEYSRYKIGLDMMGRTRGTYAEDEKAYKIVLVKSERKEIIWES